MSSFLFDLISKAKQLDIEGNYVEADRVYENLKKIANTKNHFDSRIVTSQSSINTMERPEWVTQPGSADYVAGTELFTRDKMLNNDPANSKHQALNYVNAIVNSLSRILDLNVAYNGKPHGFDLTSEVRKKLQEARKEYRKCKELLEKVQIGANRNNLNVVDKLAEGQINISSVDQNQHVSAIMTIGTAIRNLLRGITEGAVQDALKQLTHSEVALKQAIEPSLKLPQEYIDTKRNDQSAYGRNDTAGSVNPVGYKEPSSWKEKRMPDAPPDIFGATVGGSKAAINSGVDKLNNTDDSQFLNIYQGEIETIENAFIANEGKLSGREKAKYQREMKSLEDRYYTLLYKDKEKPFVD
jgi:hypothetical protein